MQRQLVLETGAGQCGLRLLADIVAKRTPDFQNRYMYHDEGRLIAITQTGQSAAHAVAEKQVDFTYDRLGRLETISRYQGGQFVAESAYTYGRFGRLVGLMHSQGDTILARYAWNYGGEWAPYSAAATTAGAAPGAGLSLPIVVMHDPNQIPLGQLGSSPFPAQLVTDAHTPDGWVHYTYDRSGQLTAAQYSAEGPVQLDESYRYDANGNRANWGNVIGPKNQLLSDGEYKYEYDAEGNRTRRTSIATGAVTEYAWDARNRLAIVTDYAAERGAATQVVTFLYDAGNRWIGEDIDRDADGVVDHQTRFAYDGEQIVLAFDKEGVGEITAADLSHRYLWGPGVDQLHADERTHADPKADVAADDVLWALADHLGSVRDQARLEGTTAKVVNHVVFGSFGEVLSESNPAEGSLFGFTGRPESEAAGLRNHWQRWTDPRIGDWMSEDPLGFAAGDTNTRRYVGNAPAMFVDPSGMDRRIVIWFGHLALEIYDPELGTTIFLEFNPKGFVENFPYWGAIPTTDWIPSTPEQDAELIQLWQELEQKRQDGEIMSWNPIFNCWVPVVEFFGGALTYPPTSFPPGWNPGDHACMNCHAPEVKAWLRATPRQRQNWHWPPTQ